MADELEGAPAPEAAVPEAPAPEASVPEAPAEPEGWSGPSQDEWRQVQAQLAQANDLVQTLQGGYEPDLGYQPAPDELPQYDPFDPASAEAYMEARDARMLGQIQNMLSPVIERESNAQAEQWANQTFERLGVPEDDMWREGVLFTSAGFQRFDAQGRALVHPQQAAQEGYQFLQRFAEAERAAEREKMKTEAEQGDAALRARAGAPQLPTGPAGAEGLPEGMDELQAARLWRERNAAAS